MLEFAEKCRSILLSSLDGVTSFGGSGKHVVIELRNVDDYYQYVSCFLPEGKQGGSGGMQIRQGYSHIALYGKSISELENALSHELTHLSLHLRTMPQWLEEGLAQMFAYNMSGQSPLEINGEMAARHKRYWGRKGLDPFWRGEGFSQ